MYWFLCHSPHLINEPTRSRGTKICECSTRCSGGSARLARIVGQVEHPAVARSELADLVADADADRSAEALGHCVHGQLVAGYRHPQRGTTELHREREPVEPIEQGGSEVQDAVADVAADVVALQQVQSPG